MILKKPWHVKVDKVYIDHFLIKIVQLNRSCGTSLLCILQINCFYIVVSRLAAVMLMSLQFTQRNCDSQLKFKHYFSSEIFNIKHGDNISLGSMTVKKINKHTKTSTAHK